WTPTSSTSGPERWSRSRCARTPGSSTSTTTRNRHHASRGSGRAGAPTRFSWGNDARVALFVRALFRRAGVQALEAEPEHLDRLDVAARLGRRLRGRSRLEGAVVGAVPGSGQLVDPAVGRPPDQAVRATVRLRAAPT